MVAALFLALPVLGLVMRTPWSDLASRLSRPGVGDAIRLSALCAEMERLGGTVTKRYRVYGKDLAARDQLQLGVEPTTACVGAPCPRQESLHD